MFGKKAKRIAELERLLEEMQATNSRLLSKIETLQKTLDQRINEVLSLKRDLKSLTEEKHAKAKKPSKKIRKIRKHLLSILKKQKVSF